MKRATMILGAVLLIAAAPAASQEGDSSNKEKPAAATDATTKEAPDKAAAAEPAAPQATEKMAKSDAALTLARLAVCKDVEDRAPVGEAESFEGVHQLYAFTRIEGAHTPTQVYHRWYVGDEMVNEIPINVKGPRWRCWSQKTIQPSWSGNCKVEVVTEEGEILGSKSFMLAAASGEMKKSDMNKEEAAMKASEAKAAGQAKAEEAKAKAAERKAEGEATAEEAEADDHAGHDHD